jgi:hypothetical protein
MQSFEDSRDVQNKLPQPHNSKLHKVQPIWNPRLLHWEEVALSPLVVEHAPEQQGETVSCQHSGVEDVEDRDARAGAIVLDAGNLWLERGDAGDYEETGGAGDVLVSNCFALISGSE